MIAVWLIEWNAWWICLSDNNQLTIQRLYGPFKSENELNLAMQVHVVK